MKRFYPDQPSDMRSARDTHFRIYTMVLYGQATMQAHSSTTNNESGLRLGCQKCEYFWTYHGTNPYFTLCPHCRAVVRMTAGRRRAEQQARKT
jgi:acetyl-CoA carboxylase beta subunit